MKKYKATNRNKRRGYRSFIDYKLKKCREKSVVLVSSEERQKEICLADKIAFPKYVSSILQLNLFAPKIKEAIKYSLLIFSTLEIYSLRNDIDRSIDINLLYKMENNPLINIFLGTKLSMSFLK